MKKNILAILIIFIMLFTFGLTACSNFPQNPSNSPSPSNNEDGDEDKLDSSGDPKISVNLTNMFADLTGAKKLGIIQKETAMMSSFSNSQGQDNNDQSGKRKDGALTIVKIDDENNTEEIVFSDENNAGKIDADFDLEIYKIFVTGDFTIMSYISSYWRSNVETKPVYSNGIAFQSYYEFSDWNYYGNYSRVECNIIDRTKGVPQYFDNTAFYNNDYIKSYIMDNRTGKIYGTEDFKVFDIINGLLVVRKLDSTKSISDVYAFDTNDSHELILKDVLPNKQVQIKDAFKDKYNWIFVQTDTLEYIDAVNKIIYFKDTRYRFASNGAVYQFGDGMPFNLYEFPAKEMINGVASSIVSKDFDRMITIYYDIRGAGWIWQSERNFMKDGIYFYDWDKNWATSYQTIHWGKDTINNRDIMLNLNYGGTRYNNWIFGFSGSKDFALQFDNGSIYYFDLDWSEVAGGGEIKFTSREFIISGVQQVPDYWTIQNGYMTLLDRVYSKISPTGTEYYQIKLGTNGKPAAVLIKNNEFNGKIIIIQPLN